MEILTIISDIIPWFVLLYLVHLLRQPVAAMMGRVAQISIGDNEIILEREISALPNSNQEPLNDHHAQLVAISPRAAVIEAWIELETIAISRLKGIDPSIPNKELHAPLILTAKLIDHELLNSHDAILCHHYETSEMQRHMPAA